MIGTKSQIFWEILKLGIVVYEFIMKLIRPIENLKTFFKAIFSFISILNEEDFSD